MARRSRSGSKASRPSDPDAAEERGHGQDPPSDREPPRADGDADPAAGAQKKAKKKTRKKKPSRGKQPSADTTGDTRRPSSKSRASGRAKTSSSEDEKKTTADPKASGGKRAGGRSAAGPIADDKPAPRRGPPRPGHGRPGPATVGAPGKSGKGGAARRKATRRTTPAFEGPRETFRGMQLNDFQMQAVGPLREGRPVLLAAPTGAGKTLVAEFAIEESLRKGKRAIYTAPIKALSNQKYRDFKAIDPDMVGLMTGDVTINPGAPVLIMTTEIFRNTIFENPAGLSDVETVVFDEIHYMDDPERGTVWEESIIFAPEHIRFVCLSATIANLQQYGDWIGAVRGQQVEVIRHTERPVPLDHYLYFPGTGIKRLEPGKVKFPKRDDDGGGRRGRRGRPSTKERNKVVDVLRRRDDLPLLFFCFSRRECEQRALETSREYDLVSDAERERLEQLFDETSAVFEIEPDRELEELRSLVRRGIAYHHAGMLPLHKELVERLFTSSLLRLLFCTETFSLGINMPARAVVFASLRKFDGTGFGPIKVREYQQMAGRAGRQGIDDQGVVVSIVDDHRVQPEDVERLISNDVEPIVSRFNLSYATLINLHRTLGDKLHEAWERSFNNFQWSRMSRKRREKNEGRQRDAIDRRMRLLHDLGYVTDEGVTDKGELAAVINGFELPVVELYSSGLLEWLDEMQVAIVFAALCFEERKNDLFRRMPTSVMGGHRRDVERCIDRLITLERDHGIPPSIRPPNFKIGIVVRDWCMGASFADMTEQTTAPAGDLVRIMRLTVQLLRQLRGALPRGDPLIKTLDRARELLNRDAVDAARQLSLG